MKTFNLTTISTFTLLSVFATAQNDANCNYPFNVQLEVQQPRCADDNDGSISLHITGGSPYTSATGSGGYVIDWDKDLFDGMSNIEIVSTGVYNVTVMDSSGCYFSTSVEIIAPDPIVVDADIVQPTSSVTGSIELNVTGGTPGYSFVWNTGNHGNLINDIVAGVYSVEIKDANQCILNESYTINRRRVLSSDHGNVISSLNYAAMRNGDDNTNAYPNPSEGQFNLTWKDNEINKITIYNQMGFAVRQFKVSGISTLEVYDLEPGMYKIVYSGSPEKDYYSTIMVR